MPTEIKLLSINRKRVNDKRPGFKFWAGTVTSRYTIHVAPQKQSLLKICSSLRDP
ncbi:hypothetical protein HanXRQr2_Chr14g0620241 [Helianthus annuus]|uniref:Uncharacterized protein n=1 Tax=Helianthus annuus TaxID=4232 RepID=A0A9K3E561_HELAN|nr:hypothetical protein HanXRQr2_Chr14g0620241 [Helianthus annuus]